MSGLNPVLLLNVLLHHREALALSLLDLPEDRRADAMRRWEDRFTETFGRYCKGIGQDECRLYSGCFIDSVDERALAIERSLSTARETQNRA